MKYIAQCCKTAYTRKHIGGHSPGSRFFQLLPVMQWLWNNIMYEVKCMRNRKWRALSLLLVLVMTAGILFGCNKTDEGTKGSDEGQKGGDTAKKDTIVIATMGEPPSMSPTDHNAIAANYMNALTFNQLTRMNEDMEMEGSLAEKYENTSDTEWLFHLRKGVKFHDGSEMTADDVVASITYAKTCPEINLYNGSVEKIEKVDDYTVKITTPGPSAILLMDLSHHGNAIVPKKLLDSGNNFSDNPIGTGPYVFKKWTRGDSVEFEMFDDYWDADHMPSIKHMIWKIIPEGSSRTIALEAGEVDFVVDVEAMDVDRLESDEGIQLDKVAATNHMWMMVNNEVPGLDNVDLRRAMNCAINKESIVTVALNGLGTPSYSMAPDNMPGATEENTLPFDPEQAKKYMEASGLNPADVHFSIICSNDTKKRAGEVIRSNLKEVLGIDCELESMDLATYLSITSEGDYTAAIGNYSSSDMTQYLIGVYHSKSVNASNKTRLSDPEVDALIDKASQTIDPDERAKVLQDCVALINELCPQVPLYQDMHMRAYKDDLGGVILYPGGQLFTYAMYWKD